MARRPVTSTEFIEIVNVGLTKGRSINGLYVKGGVRLALDTSTQNTLELNDCEFENEVHIGIQGGRPIHLKSAIFHKHLEISNVNWELIIDDTNIHAGASFFCNSANVQMTNCKELAGLFVISGYFGKLGIIDSTFGDVDGTRLEVKLGPDVEIDLSGSTLRGVKIYPGHKLAALKLDLASFQSEYHHSVDFSCINFKHVYANGTKFYLPTSFNGCTFENASLFPGAEFTTVDFSGSSMNDRFFFNSCIAKDATFLNCDFAKLASFGEIDVLNLSLSRSTFSQGADFHKAIIHVSDRETFRIIKYALFQQQNNIDALYFKSREFDEFRREIKAKGRFAMLSKNWSDRALLYLNYMSNRHGLDWFRGFICTISSGFVFYALYIWFLGNPPFEWGWEDASSYWRALKIGTKYYLEFLLPTHDLDFIKTANTNAASHFFDILGRIAVGYCIYQTISAFRKFGKAE